MPVEFGLSQKDISDKQFLYLLKKGNTSAKILLWKDTEINQQKN